MLIKIIFIIRTILFGFNIQPIWMTTILCVSLLQLHVPETITTPFFNYPIIITTIRSWLQLFKNDFNNLFFIIKTILSLLKLFYLDYIYYYPSLITYILFWLQRFYLDLRQTYLDYHYPVLDRSTEVVQCPSVLVHVWFWHQAVAH